MFGFDRRSLERQIAHTKVFQASHFVSLLKYKFLSITRCVYDLVDLQISKFTNTTSNKIPTKPNTTNLILLKLEHQEEIKYNDQNQTESTHFSVLKTETKSKSEKIQNLADNLKRTRKFNFP